MEFTEMHFFSIMAFISVVSGILLFKLLPNQSKSKRKINTKDEFETFLSQKVKQMQELYEEQINALKKERNSAQGAANRLRSINQDLKAKLHEDSDEDEEDYDDLLTSYDIDWTKAVQVGKQMGLAVENFDPNDNATKEVIQSQILRHKDVAFALGVIKPRGQVSNQETSNKSDEIDSLIEEVSKQGGQIA